MKLEVKQLILSAVGAAAILCVNAANAYTCAAGYTCFYDYGTATYSRVQGNNDYWSDFGWNNRADWFYNNGNSYNNCIYDGYDQKGTKFNLKRGYYLLTRGPQVPVYNVTVNSYWENRVSSNKWTSATTTSGCPNQ